MLPCSWRSDRDPNGPRPLAGSVERLLGREIERNPRQARGRPNILGLLRPEAAIKSNVTKNLGRSTKKYPRKRAGALFRGGRYLSSPRFSNSWRGYNPCSATIPLRRPTRKNGWRWMSKSALTLRGIITAARVFA